MTVQNSFALSVTLSVWLAGCATPSATLDLIGIARKAITDEQAQAEQMHGQFIERLKAQGDALDSAFDADVRLVANGQMKMANGAPVELSSDWVISARKGYAAARDMLADAIRSADTAHLVRQENLRVADESLDMASQLVVQNWKVTEKVKQYILNAQRSPKHD